MTTMPREIGKISTNSRFHRELRKSLSLSAIQKSVLLGALYGCLIANSSNTNVRFQTEHSAKQKDYVFWKYEIFKNFVLTPPKYLTKTRSWKFRTVSHKDFLPFHRRFYKNGRKVLPNDLRFLTDPMVLAVWYMDDGCLEKRKIGCILNTQSFTYEENMRLAKFLSGNLGLQHLSLHKDRGY